MDSVCRLSSSGKNNTLEDIIESRHVQTKIGFESNEEIEAAAMDDEKIKSIVSFFKDNVPKTQHFHIDVHQKLLKGTLLGRSYISSAELVTVYNYFVFYIHIFMLQNRSKGKRMSRFGETYVTLSDKYWELFGYCMRIVDKHPSIKLGSVCYEEWMRKGKKYINHARGVYTRSKAVSL